MASTTLSAPSQLCAGKNGIFSPCRALSGKPARGLCPERKRSMRVTCQASSIPADRVPDMEKRQLMNLLLLGALSLPTAGMLVPYASFFVPPGSGGSGGGIVAKDALGNDVIANEWLKIHGPGDRTLTQGLKTYLPVMSEANNNSGIDDPTGSSSQRPIKLDFNVNGISVGDNSTKLSSRIGKLVRTHIPISYKSWKKVPQNFKDDIWNALLKEYDIPQECRKKCDLSMPADFRQHKNKLRKRYYDPLPTHEERVANVPPSIRPEVWRSFCESEATPDAQQKRKKNKSNRSKLQYSHTSGRLGLARVEENIKKQRADRTPIPRHKLWMITHTKKDGTIPEGVAPYMEAVINIVESQGEAVSNSQSILDDPLFQVFGKDSKGRVRGVGTTISRTQIESSAPALANILSIQSENEEWKSHINRMDSTLQNVVMEMREMKALYHGQNGAQGTSCNAATVGASNSVSPTTPSFVEMSCELLNWASVVVGTGRVFRDQSEGIGHGRVLKDTEEKVVLDKINVPEEPLYLGSQGGATDLEDIGIGGVVVWPMGFINYA